MSNKNNKNVYDLLAVDVTAIWKKPESDLEKLNLLNQTERAISEGIKNFKNSIFKE